MTTEELDRAIEALNKARHAEPEEEDPDYGPHCWAQDSNAEQHGVKRWFR
jgi:hypothetical protein